MSRKTRPAVGDTYVMRHSQGLAGAVVENLDPFMSALDMAPDTEVKVSGFDKERDLVLVEWVDRFDNPRITSIEPDVFKDRFVKE
jgi:hypothetical protein